MKKTAVMHPVLLIIAGSMVMVISAVIVKLLVGTILVKFFGLTGQAEKTIKAIFTLGALFYSYKIFVEKTEKRKVTEISLTGFFKESTWGVLLGGGGIGLIISILWILDIYQIKEIYSFFVLPVWLVFFVLLAVTEELLFRGFVYRLTEQWIGTHWALIVSSLIFGGLHLANSHMSITGLLSVICGGILLGLLFTFTGKLWLPISFHAAWNFTQYLFGVNVSGADDFTPIIVCELDGPVWLTGGAFGPENSVPGIGYCLLLCVMFYLALKRNNKIIT